jgi:zinc and cadmium transporter
MSTQVLVGFNFIIFIAVLVGGVLPLYSRWLRKSLPLGLSFSAGIMLGAAFLHLIPESFALIHSSAGLWILIGFLSLYVLEKFVIIHACHDVNDDCEVHHLGISAFLGLSLHALVDGIALGAGFLIPKLGWIVGVAIALHKLPAAFALTTMLLQARYSQTKALVLQGLFFLMVPLGVLIVQFGFQEITVQHVGLLIAFASGTFLHIAYSDILPELHVLHRQRYGSLIFFIIGIGAMYGLHKWIAH